KKIVEKYGPAAIERKLTIDVDSVGPDFRVLADPNRLTQVLNNLLTNAVKFTPEGGQVKVEVKAAEGGPGFAALSIWNSGEPIAEVDLERIFDRFEQARSARTRNIQGTGLGLSICKSIVEGHGGRIWAEPSEVGARFVVVLPVQPAPEVLKPKEKPAEEPGPKAPRGTILIVEDQVELAWMLKATLLARNFRAVLAHDGESALNLARKHKPSIITVDMKLPDIDGLKLLEIFRHDADTRNAKLLVLSGYDERDRAMRAGASGYLRKPLEPDKLIAAVEGLSQASAHRGRVLVLDDDPQICAI